MNSPLPSLSGASLRVYGARNPELGPESIRLALSKARLVGWRVKAFNQRVTLRERAGLCEDCPEEDDLPVMKGVEG